MFRFFFLFFFASLAAKADHKLSATNHHVIIISIDGFAAYLFDDPKTPIPTLRKLAAEGVRATGMKVSSPAVTWPNHTTLVTGVSPEKHSVLYNGIMVREKNAEAHREQEHDKSELVRVPTLYDFLHEKKFTTAAINWPCTRNAKTLDDNFPDVPSMIRHSSPRLIQELVDEKILNSTGDLGFALKNPVERDDVWNGAACLVLRERKPNLLLLHLLVTDVMQHKFGPQSAEGYEALGNADQHIKQLLETLNGAGLREETTIFILADHGFARVTKTLLPNVALRQAGLHKTSGISKSRVQIVSEGGIAMVYFNAPETREEDRKKTIELFRNHEGIDQVLEPKDFKKYGMPLPENNSQMGDLVLSAKDGYAFGSGSAGEESVLDTVKNKLSPGSHGYLSDNPKMNALFIAWGRGIQKGKQIGVIENIDVAPTAAALLGEKFPQADGKVLREISTSSE